MSITLTRDDTSAVLALNKDLVWADEHQWAPTSDVEERTVTGGLIVEPWTMVAGRPVTLQSDGDDFGLVLRSQVETLRAWSAVAGLTLELSFHGQVMAVNFRALDGPAVAATPIWTAGAPSPTDRMQLTLKLRTL
jgi:hypothetical protein